MGHHTRFSSPTLIISSYAIMAFLCRRRTGNGLVFHKLAPDGPAVTINLAPAKTYKTPGLGQVENHGIGVE